MEIYSRVLEGRYGRIKRRAKKLFDKQKYKELQRLASGVDKSYREGASIMSSLPVKKKRNN